MRPSRRGKRSPACRWWSATRSSSAWPAASAASAVMSPPTTSTTAGSGGGTTAWGRTTRWASGLASPPSIPTIAFPTRRSTPGPATSWRRGGGAVWGWFTYDAELNLFYYGTSKLRPLESGLPPGVGRSRARRGRGPDRVPEQLLRVDPGPRRRHRRPDLGLQHDPPGSVGPRRAQREPPRRPRDRRPAAQGAGPPGAERLLLRVRSRDGRDDPRALDVRLQTTSSMASTWKPAVRATT